jgi:enterochelin esterase-like enzyme
MHGQYGTYVEDELLPDVMHRYGDDGTKPLFLGGLSMGGFTALNVAFHEPAAVAGVGALSPAFFVSPPRDREWMYSADGSATLFDLAAAGAADGKRLFLGYGTTDYPWIKDATAGLASELSARGDIVQPEIVTGGHELATWQQLAEPMLLQLFGADGESVARPCSESAARDVLAA